MTRQEIIFKCMSLTDYFSVSDMGIMKTLQTMLVECGFRYKGSSYISPEIISIIFPAVYNFDIYCRDTEYKMSAFRAIYYNTISKNLTENLPKDLKEYDKAAAHPRPKGEVGDFW